MVAWKNPLWRKPSEWKIIGKPSKPSRSARKNDNLIAAMMIRAQRQVDRERSRRRYDAIHRTIQT